MRGLVENLLTLARADARQISAQRQSVGVGKLLRQAWRPFDAQAAARNLTVNWNADSQATLDSDPGLLTMVLSNLFDNAVSYADERGHIDIALLNGDGAVRCKSPTAAASSRGKRPTEFFGDSGVPIRPQRRPALWAGLGALPAHRDPARRHHHGDDCEESVLRGGSSLASSRISR